MTGQARFHAILRGESDHCGFWHGHPNPESTAALYRYFGVKDDFELGLKLGNCCRWVWPDDLDVWDYAKKPLFDVLGGQKRYSLSQPGVFADYTDEDLDLVEQFPWPDAADLDFTRTLEEIDRTVAAGQAVLSGNWCPFFHQVSDFFGMENYFIKMYTDPELVTAVTRHVVDFYLAANRRLFDLAGDKIDAAFFGNDFGTQRDLLISPACFDQFVLPYFKEFTDLAHSRGYWVMVHSCGSIVRVIPRLIDAGVNALHPIQALAAGMDAESLTAQFGGKLAFVGGVDTQQLLPFGTPEQVAGEVRRLKAVFGPNFIVSPSHESILPNVPPENVEAMARAAEE